LVSLIKLFGVSIIRLTNSYFSTSFDPFEDGDLSYVEVFNFSRQAIW